ncbi:MAG TPA: flagellar biosynthetic protein FliQ [Bryobacteraceae bacterium]|nr:flagellar biosynthetic protein FliQ [Bryobacteraceae bacterium]
MTPQLAVDIVRQALMAAVWVSAPLLIAGFVVGIAISLFQVATSMQDPGVTTVPRLAGFLVALAVALPWMLQRLMSYTVALFGDFARYAR